MQHLFDRIQPQEPIATGSTVNDAPLEGIKTVVFDIYGTLIISSSGDIGSSDMQSTAAEKSFEECKICLKEVLPYDDMGHRILSLYHEEILESHRKDREKGFPHPEVDIVEIWKGVTEKMSKLGYLDCPASTLDHKLLSVTFETHNNSVYPMPAMEDTLNILKDRGLPLGIVSNAQFFTPLILKHFFSSALDGVLPYFDPELQVYSYQLRRAKPDNYLYTLMVEKLRERGIEPSQCLYVGNDMLNDIVPAQEEGFKTVLFAGDKRSLRLREDHPRCHQKQPDRVITSLSQLLNILKG
jgi:putative hydrolase of the HAD superfamily